MSRTEALLRTAVANPNLTSVRPERFGAARPRYFTTYRVELPLPDFSGVPTDWVFVIQDPEQSQGVDRASLLSDVHDLLASIPKEERVILVSDDRAAHLGDEFDGLRRDVFCLDALEFSDEARSTQPRNAPFLRSVRRKAVSDPLIALQISPYLRAKPVWGWRFFGRRRQIAQILTGDENYMIVGARRVGKTSLMREACRQLREKGEIAHFVDVQNCRSAGDVVREILHEVSLRGLARWARHSEQLGEAVLSSALRRLSSGKHRTTLFLDELGNVLANMRSENWGSLGLLRKFSENGRLRVVLSCSQEVFLRRQQEFSGPLINFAATMRIRAFTRPDVEEFLLAPLRFWRNLDEREEKALVDMVMSRVGTHPFLLQSFSAAFYQRLADSAGAAGVERRLELVRQANALFKARLIECFESAIDELFFRLPSPLLQYLFLRRCRDAELRKERLDQADFDLDWLEAALLDVGYRASFQGLRTVLEALEMHSLCSAVRDLDNRMVIAAPVVYDYMQKVVPSVDAMLKKLAEDVRREDGPYGLTPVTADDTARQSRP